MHKGVYDWFEVSFDHFGRTTTPQQTAVAQEIFWDLYNNGFIEQKTTEQLCVLPFFKKLLLGTNPSNQVLRGVRRVAGGPVRGGHVLHLRL